MAIAGRLMGSALSVHGYDAYWIAKAQLEANGRAASLTLGGHQAVTGPAEWADLMAAHDASELAAAAERGDA